MEALFLLVPLAIVLVGIAGVAFVRAVAQRQFDNLDVHGLDILDDSETTRDENTAL